MKRLRRPTVWPALAGLAQAASIAMPGSGLAQGWLQVLSLAALAAGLLHITQTENAWAAAWRRAAWFGGVFATAWLAGSFWWLYVSMHDVGGLPAPLAALAVLLLASAVSLFYVAAAAGWVNGNSATVAPNMWRMAGMSARDVGSVQSYENFTGGVLMALAEHGFFAPEEANDFLKLENLLAPSGRLPLNTSGGNLAECYMHGFELVLEAVRQVRGQSTAQAARRDVALVIGGPLVSPVSNLLLGSEATL